ncbi:Phenazine biosynthesis-like protein [Clavibacter michiganensis subsp. michiganensis]|uniref:Phenazine biosynthesis-like protein n=1 Tax=Clavibacter michiganensis subsp. michiganensis TaxID=33013 RepID=A0A251XE46_CLAMM|nr:Phenazine biosynthesis-like protein [Clavibacter michiganensis subsp. michiganensis]OUE00229.1 Phenazine biosynthesis-like protein [Clavibacter michiganensis subsp. michiganensis]
MDRAGDEVRVTADPAWGPEFAWHPVGSAAELLALDLPALAEASGIEHLYAWAWVDESAGWIRARMSAPALGVPEDEATGSAALRVTATSAAASASRRAAAASWSRGCSTTAAPRSAAARSRTA